jgi:RNA polymerase sigma-70 factor (ECF subfamily)
MAATDPRRERAFRTLYDRHYDRLFRTAYYYLHNDDDAQETVLDVFVKLWQRPALLDDIADPEAYLFILTKNAALNRLAREQRPDAVPLAPHHDAHADEHHNPETDLLSDDLLRRYLTALDSLPARCREVFLLVREEGLSYADTAARLAISPKTVDAQLQRALRLLRRALAD